MALDSLLSTCGSPVLGDLANVQLGHLLLTVQPLAVVHAAEAVLAVLAAEAAVLVEVAEVLVAHAEAVDLMAAATAGSASA